MVWGPELALGPVEGLRLVPGGSVYFFLLLISNRQICIFTIKIFNFRKRNHLLKENLLTFTGYGLSTGTGYGFGTGTGTATGFS